jgi:hypothetical protein
MNEKSSFRIRYDRIIGAGVAGLVIGGLACWAFVIATDEPAHSAPLEVVTEYVPQYVTEYVEVPVEVEKIVEVEVEKIVEIETPVTEYVTETVTEYANVVNPEKVTLPSEWPGDTIVCGLGAKPALDYRDDIGWWAYCEPALVK